MIAEDGIRIDKDAALALIDWKYQFTTQVIRRDHDRRSNRNDPKRRLM